MAPTVPKRDVARLNIQETKMIKKTLRKKMSNDLEMETCKNLCSECPFAQESAPGWLGPYKEPAGLHRMVMADMPFPCHKKQDKMIHFAEVGSKRYPLCRGALAYMKKNGKRHRIESVQKAINKIKEKELEQAFTVPEFIEHHTI